jgi:hypothetical protein
LRVEAGWRPAALAGWGVRTREWGRARLAGSGGGVASGSLESPFLSPLVVAESEARGRVRVERAPPGRDTDGRDHGSGHWKLSVLNLLG